MENQIDLKQKSVVELKALAYDLGIMVNEYRNMLNIVNQEIIDRTKQNGQVEVAQDTKAEEVKDNKEG